MQTLKHFALAALIVGTLLAGAGTQRALADAPAANNKADGAVVVGPAPNVIPIPIPEYKRPGHHNVVLDPSYLHSSYLDNVLKQGEAGSCRQYRLGLVNSVAAVGWLQAEENDYYLGIPFRRCAYIGVAELVVGFPFDLFDDIPVKTVTRASLSFQEHAGDWNDNGGKTGCVTTLNFGPRPYQTGPDSQLNFSVTDPVAELVSKQPGSRIGWEFVLRGAFDINDLRADGSSSCMSTLDNILLQVYYDVPSPALPPLSGIEVSATTAKRCAICSALGSTPAPAPAPTLPDFKIMAVRAVQPHPDPVDKNKELLANGMTATYEVVVANLGARIPAQVISTDPNPPQPKVQLSIQVTGAAQYLSITNPDSWDCSGKGPILCVGPLGGYGDTIQDTVVTFRLQILGAKVGSGVYAGVGAISAAADPNGLIKESDITNNALTLAITVK